MDSRKRRYEIKSNEIRNLKRRRNRNRNRNRDRNKYRNKYRNKEVISLFIIIALVGAIGIFTCIFLLFQQKKEKPQELIQKYMNYITAKDYENMYQMINIEGSGGISQEDFEKRNAAIYEGIEMEHMKVKVHSSSVRICNTEESHAISRSVRISLKAYQTNGLNQYIILAIFISKFGMASL